ncbi:hypothetical protein KUTeg_006213 [Tegillarca granosa]|uniref:C2H2-type domain-containing protein n=1 Tax=Tegillarca granosa TaxID=220873 RepID=A0ABQ9FFX6_TEGGR|nr:hypothetical protein KUTeg_006213 [Tegillarca granosa]
MHGECLSIALSIIKFYTTLYKSNFWKRSYSNMEGNPENMEADLQTKESTFQHTSTMENITAESTEAGLSSPEDNFQTTENNEDEVPENFQEMEDFSSENLDKDQLEAEVQMMFNSIKEEIKKQPPKSASTKKRECDICHRVFTTSSNLTQHKLVHSGIKPHSCDICGRNFAHSGNLSKHRLLHAETKPHGCDVCGNLARHRLVHSETKPYKCETCGKQYTHAYSLSVHTLRHTGNYPFRCDICGKGFVRLSHLTSHAVKHLVGRKGNFNLMNFRTVDGSKGEQNGKVEQGNLDQSGMEADTHGNSADQEDFDSDSFIEPEGEENESKSLTKCKTKTKSKKKIESAVKDDQGIKKKCPSDSRSKSKPKKKFRSAGKVDLDFGPKNQPVVQNFSANSFSGSHPGLQIDTDSLVTHESEPDTYSDNLAEHQKVYKN